MKNELEFFEKLVSIKTYLQTYFEFKKISEAPNFKKDNRIMGGNNLYELYNKECSKESTRVLKALKNNILQIDSTEKIKNYLEQHYQSIKALFEDLKTDMKMWANENVPDDEEHLIKFKKEHKTILSSIYFHLRLLKESFENNFSNYIKIDIKTTTPEQYNHFILNQFSELQNKLSKEHKEKCKIDHIKEVKELTSNFLMEYQKKYVFFVKNFILFGEKLGHQFTEQDFINTQLKIIANQFKFNKENKTYSVTDYNNQQFTFQEEFYNTYISIAYEQMKEYLMKRVDELNIVQSPEKQETTIPTKKDFTTARQVLAIHYLLEYTKVKGIDNTVKARFIQFLTGKEPNAKNIKDTTLYKKVCSPFKTNDKAFKEDMRYVKGHFQNLGMLEIVKMIDNEIDKEN